MLDSRAVASSFGACDMLSFNVLVLGDEHVGKTAFVRRHVGGEFEKRYCRTVGVHVNKFTFQTQFGDISFRTFDVAGQERSNGFIEAHFKGAHAAMIMFETASGASVEQVLQQVRFWVRSVRTFCGRVPLVLCRTKADATLLDTTGLTAIKALVFDVKCQHLRDECCRASCLFLCLCVRRLVGKDIAKMLGLYLWMTRRESIWGPDSTEYSVEYVEVSSKTCLNFEEPFLQLARKLTGVGDLEFVCYPTMPPPDVEIDCVSDADLLVAMNCVLPDDSDEDL